MRWLCVASLLCAQASEMKPQTGAVGSSLVNQLRYDVENAVAMEGQATPLAILVIAKHAAGRWSLKPKNPLRILSVQSGIATFKTRKLPAAIVTAELTFRNVEEATYDLVKFY